MVADGSWKQLLKCDHWNGTGQRSRSDTAVYSRNIQYIGYKTSIIYENRGFHTNMTEKVDWK